MSAMQPDECASMREETVRRNQFKRQTPPIAKVSARTVGVDFLYARDWGT